MNNYDDSSLLAQLQDRADSLRKTAAEAASASTDAVRAESGMVSFSIGICSSGESSDTLGKLMGVIKREDVPTGFVLKRIIIVASAPSLRTVSLLGDLAARDGRVIPIYEARRRGKIEAVNRIIQSSTGRYLVFVNADALPEPGAIAKLLIKAESEPRAGLVSARPTFQPSGDLTSSVLEFMWAIHNASSLKLNHLGMSNHASDELMVVRSEVLSKLPDDVINDGAYISGHAFSEGYRILFMETAGVSIDVPATIYQLIEQRRRILFGHARVWKKLGRPPLTLESLMLKSPTLSASLMVNAVAVRPRRLLAVPVALVAEVTAAVLSITDRLFLSDPHKVWKRYRR